MPDDPSRIASMEFEAPWARVRGRVTRRGQVSWSPCLRTFKGPDGRQHSPTEEPAGTSGRAGNLPSGTKPGANAITDQPGEHGYWIACETEEGQTLASTAVEPRWFSEDQDLATFSTRLAYHRATRRVVLGRGERRLGELDVPASMPDFDLSSPVRVEDIDTTGILHLRWEARSGAKKHAHTYFVRFTSDGQRFYRVGFGLSGSGFDLDLRTMPGGERCYAQVLATNGYQTTVAATPAFSLPTKPPQLMLGPLDGPTLFGQGFSLEHGPITGEHIEWAADGQTVGSGGSLDARSLGEGRHVVSVTITSPDGEHVSQDLGLYDGRSGKLLEGTRQL